MDKYIRLNIAFRPSALTEEYAKKISRQFSRIKATLFVLEDKKFYPHITIYSSEFPSVNKEKVASQLMDIAFKIESRPLMKFETTKNNEGFLGVHFEKTDIIKKIHQRIINVINPLREEHIRSKYMDDKFRKELSNEQRMNIEKYGHPDVMKLYSPHLTITRTKIPGDAQELNSKLEWPFEAFTADAITLFEMGDNGTCTKIIKEYLL